jgi:Xaa-Pro aminopeptidase
VWKRVDNEFKLNKESNAEVLCNIIRNYIAEHGLYPDIHSLAHGHGIKDFIDIHQAMIDSIIELLENKGLATYQEWVKIMDQKVKKE